MTIYYDPPKVGTLVVTPLGRSAVVVGYDGDGRCELRYRVGSGDDTNGEIVAIWPKFLHRPLEG